MEALLQKLNQESTWRGIVAVAAGFGVTMSPELQEHIIAAALAVIGIINIFKKD